jgi:hypothetical protein
VIGLPQVYANARTFSDPQIRPILERMARGRVLDAHDPVRTRYLANSWAWGKIVLGGLAILAFRLRGLALVWWLTFFGFAMANSALLTGLEFENFHWVYVHAPMGEILILAVVARLLDRWNPGRAIRNRLLWVVPGVLLVVAAIWRPYEALHAPEANQLNQLIEGFQLDSFHKSLEKLGPDRVLSAFTGTEVALLFSRCGLLWHEPHSHLSSLSSLESVHERHALNAWLQGYTLEQYRMLNRESPFLVVPSGDTGRWSPEAAARRREEIFESIEADGGAKLLARYRPDVMILLEPSRGGPWRLLNNGGSPIWVRDYPAP